MRSSAPLLPAPEKIDRDLNPGPLVPNSGAMVNHVSHSD